MQPNHKVKHLVPIERSITRNIYVKYQNSSTCCGKIINKIKVFKKKAKLQGHLVKKYWYMNHKKSLVTKCTHVKYPLLKFQHSLFRYILARLKFQTEKNNTPPDHWFQGLPPTPRFKKNLFILVFFFALVDKMRVIQSSNLSDIV